jgi:hypothetical protein
MHVGEYICELNVSQRILFHLSSPVYFSLSRLSPLSIVIHKQRREQLSVCRAKSIRGLVVAAPWRNRHAGGGDDDVMMMRR